MDNCKSALLLMVFSLSTAIHAQIKNASPVSPLLEQLSQDIKQGNNKNSLQNFWQEMIAKGGPIVETITGNDSCSLITFIYKDSSTINKVRLQSNINALLIKGIVDDFDNIGWLEKLSGSDIWYISYAVSNTLRAPYLFEVYKKDTLKDSILKQTVTDPFNKRVYQPQNKQLLQSFFEMKQAPSFSLPVTDSEKGKWLQINILSSKRQRKEKIYVYLPRQADTLSHNEYPIIVGLESFTFGVAMPSDKMIDALCDHNKIRVPVLVCIDNKSYSDKPDLDSLGLFLFEDVLPQLQKRFPLSKKPGDIIIAGTSRRGLAASYLVFNHPDKAAKVLSMSGSFFWKPSIEKEYEWMSRQLANSPVRNINFYISAGNLETVVTPGNKGHYMVATNRHLRDILVAKKYTFHYHEFEGVHHELNWQYEFYEGLIYFLSRH